MNLRTNLGGFAIRLYKFGLVLGAVGLFILLLQNGDTPLAAATGFIMAVFGFLVLFFLAIPLAVIAFYKTASKTEQKRLALRALALSSITALSIFLVLLWLLSGPLTVW